MTQACRDRRRHEPMQKQAFQSRVIGKIRDEGIILAVKVKGADLTIDTKSKRRRKGVGS
jgi:hypothetical protein